MTAYQQTMRRNQARRARPPPAAEEGAAGHAEPEDAPFTRAAGQAARQEPPEAGPGKRRAARPKEVAYQRKVAAARAVGYRETLLMQLNAVVLHWPRRQSAQRSAAEAARLLKNVASELRTAGLRCVEKIVAWVLVESKDCARPRPFLWNGRDYLLKMSDDLDFVSEALGVGGVAAGVFL